MSKKDIPNTFLNTRFAIENRIETNRLHEKLIFSDIPEEVEPPGKMLANLKTLVSQMPDVKNKKIEEIKSKLQNGFYDRREVIEQVANNIINALNIKKDVTYLQK